MEIIIPILIFIALVGIYILPTVLAFHRDHHNRTSLMIINLLLGWSGIFWVLSLAWVFWNHDAPAKANAAEKMDTKTKKSIWPIIITILLIGVIALLGLNIMSNGSNNALTSASLSDAGNATAEQAGVPMSADDYLNNQ